MSLVAGVLPNLFSFSGFCLTWVSGLSSLFVWQFYIAPRISSFANLPGPERDSLLWGNMQTLFKKEPGDGHEVFVKEFGPTLRYTAFIGMQRFYTADPKAIAHILANGYEYPKPERVRVTLRAILGEGLIASEGEDHKRARRIMVSSFSAGNIREMTETFFSHSYQLRDKMLEMIRDDKPTEIEMLKWLDKCTLDIIGNTGFGYNFNALNSDHNELADAFHDMWVAGSEMSLMVVLSSFFPILKKFFPTQSALKAAIAMETMDRIGTELVQSKKRAILASLQDEKDGEVSAKKEDLVGKDLLSTMIRSNMATDIPLHQKITDKEVIGQISTFMVAGQETSATAVGWALFSLCNYPEIQDKLREELFTIDSDAPVMEDLIGLPYLDSVVRETLRLFPPVPSTHREATKDDILPLAFPVTNTRNGKTLTEIPIAKGTSIFVPIINLNTMEEIWGPDAKEFKPERWINGIPETAKAVPGVWSNMTTFVGGPRGCIGYRYALAEVKAMLFVLIRSFVFKHLDVKPAFEKRKYFLIIRPHIKGSSDKGASLPLMVTPYTR